jgi:DMSO reductase family type II enzyme heme b subunit
MRVHRISNDRAGLARADAKGWLSVPAESINLAPSPLGLTAHVSPYLANSLDHGLTRTVSVRMAHDGQFVSVRMEWLNKEPRNQPADLDSFTDAAAIMFSSDKAASAISMGAAGTPVNAWLWRADEAQPYDVIAEGYATSIRRDAGISSLSASQQHSNDHRMVVLQRPLSSAEASCVELAPGSKVRVAFAIWAGVNNERSGQKAVSGEFVDLDIDK